MTKETEKKLNDIVLEDDSKINKISEMSDHDLTELKKKLKKLEKKVKSLNKKLLSENEKNEKLETEKNDYIAHLQKERAEFENFRKRKQAEVSMSFQNGVFDAVLKILPVLDNLELALNNVPEEKEDDDFIKGVGNLSKLFLDTLASMGVTQIDALGKPFNHDIHDAMMQVEKKEDEEEGIVTQVLQKGYKKDDKVIRYAKVIVTK
jgi:molecular chaperone GrpE